MPIRSARLAASVEKRGTTGCGIVTVEGDERHDVRAFVKELAGPCGSSARIGRSERPAQLVTRRGHPPDREPDRALPGRAGAGERGRRPRGASAGASREGCVTTSQRLATPSAGLETDPVHRYGNRRSCSCPGHVLRDDRDRDAASASSRSRIRSGGRPGGSDVTATAGALALRCQTSSGYRWHSQGRRRSRFEILAVRADAPEPSA